MGDNTRSRHESDILHRQLDQHLARVRADLDIAAADLVQAERLVDHLRVLIEHTVHASAADRARVRAAVHYYVLCREARPPRPAHVDVWVVNDILRGLGRQDLLLPEAALP